MRSISIKVFVAFAFVLFFAACSEEEEQEVSYTIQTYSNSYTDLSSFATKYPEARYKELIEATDSIVYYAGKSVAIFGGSISSSGESNICKSMYSQLLHCAPIVTYGHGGFGFATQNGSVQGYLSMIDVHDIYILWCSTNDYTYNIPVGNATDYTETDGYDESHTNTQCGGINKCIHTIKKKNPNALIVGFTSLHFFDENASREDGYFENSTKKNKRGNTFKDYVDRQRETFELAGIPYFDQYNCGLFDVDNYANFYLTDGFHLNEDGYFLLGCEQIRFFIDLINEMQ